MHDLSTTRPDGLLLSRLVHGRKPKKRWDGSYLFSSSRGRFHRFSRSNLSKDDSIHPVHADLGIHDLE